MIVYSCITLIGSKAVAWGKIALTMQVHDIAMAAVAAAGAVIFLSCINARRRRNHHLLLNMEDRRPARIAYLNTEDAEKWTDQREIFAQALGLPSDALEPFDTFKGEYPTREALQQGRYSGVLITGSHYSAIDPTLSWLPGLFDCIRMCASMPHVRLLGCCFGCQAVAVALGGLVGKNPSGKFIFGTERVVLDRKACDRQLGWCKSGSATSPPSLLLLESHGDQVLQLPQDARLLGWSDTAPHELFLCGEYCNILCCQSHPEFDVSLMRSRIEPALRGKGRMTEDEMNVAVQGMSNDELNSDIGCELYRHFLLSRSMY